MTKMKTLEAVAQDQIDNIMDTFDFAEASEVLRAVEHCWLNSHDCEMREREMELRIKSRERLKAAFAYAKMADKEGDLRRSTSNSGCILGECTICEEEGDKWVRLNLVVYVAQSLNDGEEWNTEDSRAKGVG